MSYLCHNCAVCCVMLYGTMLWNLGVLCNIGYLSETHLKPKSCEISFACNLFINYPIVMTFCTEHASDTAMLCTNFQIDWTTEVDVMDEWDFVRFEFQISFRRISYIAQHPQAAMMTLGTLDYILVHMSFHSIISRNGNAFCNTVGFPSQKAKNAELRWHIVISMKKKEVKLTVKLSVMSGVAMTLIWHHISV